MPTHLALRAACRLPHPPPGSHHTLATLTPARAPPMQGWMATKLAGSHSEGPGEPRPCQELSQPPAQGPGDSERGVQELVVGCTAASIAPSVPSYPRPAPLRQQPAVSFGEDAEGTLGRGSGGHPPGREMLGQGGHSRAATGLLQGQVWGPGGSSRPPLVPSCPVATPASSSPSSTRGCGGEAHRPADRASKRCFIPSCIFKLRGGHGLIILAYPPTAGHRGSTSKNNPCFGRLPAK